MKCEWHDAPPEQRKTFAGVKFLVQYAGGPGMIVRCICDDATKRWRRANRPDDNQ